MLQSVTLRQQKTHKMAIFSRYFIHTEADSGYFQKKQEEKKKNKKK